MVRPVNRINTWLEPPVPRPSATILLLRDKADGIEVLMTRRSAQASFAPGAFVFPGGTLDEQDRRFAETLSPQGLTEAAHRWSGGDAELAPFACAAIREAFEELGVLLADDPLGHLLTPEQAHTFDRHPDRDFFEQLTRAEARPALDRLHALARWITDRDLPRRFDTIFFVARVPEGQVASADGHEQFEPVWVSPAEALSRHELGDFHMVFPTLRTLRRLRAFHSVAQVIDHCRNQSNLWTSCPRAGVLGDRVERYTEDETAYGELELVAPDGRITHRLDWQHAVPVRLMRNLQRLTAPNPGRMTGPGTNTYIVGDDDCGYLVIDPGPDDFSHIARIHAVVGQRLQAIVCTHAHQDHSPGAAPLKSLTGAPVLGRPTGPDFNPLWTWTPDRTVHDGDRIQVGATTLRVIHTPGHTEHHICLLMEEDEILLSGDHILNGSTTVITPPDGNMRDYIQSLERLRGERFDQIAPAHGHILGQGKHEVDRLIAHRFKRENKVIDALLALPESTVDELVESAYDDTPRVLHDAAKRSLLAHLLKLREDGRAECDEPSGRWVLRH
jgi:glyoxylase-like metal-dependent hydrolase (beta-lactamase superfamily II)/8-oxo-dGTP pyrophosphatase MutT (NUDIX family)